MSTVTAAHITWESIQVGDELPKLQKTETQETINNYGALNRRDPTPRPTRGANLHTDEEYAKQGIFAGTVNMGVVTCAYMMETLQLAFPTSNLLNGAFSMRALEPFRPGDLVTFGGRVLDKRVEGGKRLVDVELSGVNQLGQTVATAKATVPL
ncbi:MAG: MaoC family dehydratase [Chloroflexi bacterium]|nr:MaoC family dehydratase [Chloroflexota bacterium]